MTAASNMRLLMWVYARSFVNGLVRGDIKSRLKNIGMLLSRVGAFAIFYLFFRYLLFQGTFIAGAGPGQISSVASSMIHALGAFLLLGAIKFAYQVFYLSADLEWLLSSPLPVSRVFIAKFIENCGYGGNIVFSFGWPIVIAYGAFVGAPVAYYPVAMLTTAVLAVYSGAMGVLICLPLMRYVTTNRLRELLLTLSMGLTIGIYILFRNIGSTVEGRGAEFHPAWLPTTHLGDIIIDSASGKWSSIPGSLAIFVLPAIAIAFTAYIVSLRIYITGLQRKGEKEEKIRARAGEGLLYRLSGLLPADIRSVVIKDALETIRSPRQWFYLIFAVVFLGFQFLHPGDYGQPMVHLFLILFIVSVFSQELTVLAISREADMFHLIAVGGMAAWRFYIAKWLVAFIPTVIFALAATLVGGILRGYASADTAADLAVVLLAVIPLISYSLMIGCLFPDFKAYRSRRRVSPWVLILNMIFTMLLILLIIVPIYFVRVPVNDTPNPLWLNIVLIAFAVASAILITAISFTLGSARLRRFLKDVPTG